jgi:hypothetical protein
MYKLTGADAIPDNTLMAVSTAGAVIGALYIAEFALFI